MSRRSRTASATSPSVRREQPALAGGDVLRRVEREAGRVGEAAELAAAVGALDRVRGVLDDREPERPERVEVARLAGEVDGQDRLRPLGHELGDARRIDVQVVVAARRTKTGVAPCGRSRSRSRAT